MYIIMVEFSLSRYSCCLVGYARTSQFLEMIDDFLFFNEKLAVFMGNSRTSHIIRKESIPKLKSSTYLDYKDCKY